MTLSEYLKLKGETAAAFAIRTKISDATISRLARGLNRPDWRTVDTIMAATQGAVTPNDWLATKRAKRRAA